jgi:hypothetical protein
MDAEKERMRSVQVSKPNGAFEVIERKLFQNLVKAKSVSRFKHVAYAMAILSQNKDYFQAYNIQEFQAMR